MVQPLISIVLTTYNRSHMLPRAVESVFRGGYENFELIIVDDASTDGTERYASGLTDHRVKYLRQPENGGVLKARNRGFDAARGDLIAMLDDDDELEPNALQVVVQAFERADNAAFDVLWFNCRDAESGDVSGRIVEENAPVRFEDYLCGRVHGDFWMVFRKEALAGQRFDERLKAHESLLWLRIHRRHRARHSAQVVCRKYREHGAPRLCDIDVRMGQLRHTTLAMERFLEEFGHDVAKACPKVYGARLAYLGLHQLATSEFAAGRASIRRSLRYRFSWKYMLLYFASFVISSGTAMSVIRRAESN